ncbi:MAG: FAD-dependent oxidoreductase [Thermoleophilaceae bacterium]
MSAQTRRELLREAAVLGASAALASAPGAASASTHRRRRSSRVREVAIIGGGVGGLSAAHELAERGFRVTVYERRALGGKARSMGVPGSAAGGRRPLPGEHGARFFPGLYQNLPDTMRRIPFGSNPNGTFDNLATAHQESFPRSGGREDLNANYAPADPYPWTFEQFRETVVAALQLSTRIPPQEIEYFVQRLCVYFSSCDARRLEQWEHVSWWDFTSAGRYSEDYQRMLISAQTRNILSARATEACARTIGLLWELGLYTFMGRGSNGTFDRVLDAPTNEAWIDPWVAYLRGLGVRFVLGAEVDRLEMREGRVVGARARRRGRRERISADWFVCAVPVERARHVLGSQVLAADPRLQRLASLVTRWQNGIQFYLREPTPIVQGHVVYIDSPWALSSISQAQFWTGRDFPRDYGDGSVRDCMSVDIADFDVPGIVYGKPARQLQPDQIAHEAWEQMKAHLNDTGRRTLRDESVVRWFLDPGLVYEPRRSAGALTNDDPLMISTPGAWANRPDAATAVPNLFLAADFVRVNIDTATMEGANEAARRAVNALLAAARSSAEPVEVHELYKPPEWEPFRAADEERFRLGLPNALDTSPPPSLPHLPIAARK